MKTLFELFEKNRRWAGECIQRDAHFFERLAEQQSPNYLWIGCSDSRVPANQITGLEPGQVFVHRNIANLVIQTDFSMLSVLQYAVDVLKVEHVIVCGHYGCGGVRAALENERHGLIDNWLRHIQDVAYRRAAEMEQAPEGGKLDRLCELNVVAQARNLCRTTVVQDAWERGQKLEIHSWIYRLNSGKLLCLEDPMTAENHA
ncbi:MAG: carbonate dehydratase [Verrucomicrobiae bacterium]|nr:carbonate dehydratase [Verrucomicrobiae bacterium]NNJ87132.1 carbonate dehydratase [Akkermansiaceae bacterium]